MPNCMMSHFCDRSYSIDQKKLLCVRPKPGFGIGDLNQGPISVSETIFFSETETFFFQKSSNFLFFPTSFGGISFYNLEY